MISFCSPLIINTDLNCCPCFVLQSELLGPSVGKPTHSAGSDPARSAPTSPLRHKHPKGRYGQTATYSTRWSVTGTALFDLFQTDLVTDTPHYKLLQTQRSLICSRLICYLLQTHRTMICYRHSTLWFVTDLFVTDTPHYGLLQTQHSLICSRLTCYTHHTMICYRHTTLWFVRDTPHYDLLQTPNTMICYRHQTLWFLRDTPNTMICYRHQTLWFVTDTKHYVTDTKHYDMLETHHTMIC